MALASATLSLMVTACGKEEKVSPPKEVLDGFNQRGASLAKFSVSLQKQVRFSRGNLQYQASTRQWRFAPRQFECLGTSNDNISATNSGWIDLFGWGTSGWDKGGAKFFQPWEISDSSAGYGPGENSLSGSNQQADWAYFNPIDYGGDTAKYWRTLSAGEWSYLLAGRREAVAKVGIASVEGVNGLVILPDEWVVPSGITFIAGISDTVDIDYTQYNRFSETEWILMETAGAIFLPAVGCRTGKKTADINRYGFYWSSTSVGDKTVASNVSFSTKTLVHDNTTQRHYGLAVRPVVDAN